MKKVIILFTLFLSSCIGYASREFPGPVPEWNQSGDSRNLYIEINKTATVNDSPFNKSTADAGMYGTMEEEIWKSFGESGYFNVVSGATGAMHMIVDLSMERHASTFLLFLSSMSLTVIPFTGSEIITMSVKVYDEEGRLVGSYQRKGKFTYWTQLLLFIPAPFINAYKAKTGLIHDLCMSIESELIGEMDMQ